jgi:crotonobetainyl-CoA:carnitine CoA-transferase CaiB-like acyl-CoA transferase
MTSVQARGGPLPMDGIRVLDLATFVAAPYAASILGEFGADVIKVELPGVGDPLRDFGTPREGDSSLCWLTESRNKKSITLSLSDPKGAEIFRKLVQKTDVICENFRPGTLEKWGVGFSDLLKINPKLIMLSVSGFGQNGPMRELPGFARIAHAFAGLTHLTGEPGGPPLTPGSTSLADYLTGLNGAVGILMALRVRDLVGGQQIDLALYESCFRVLDDIAPTYARDGAVRGRQGVGTGNACPHGHFEAQDHKWISLACSSDKMFFRFCKMIGREELAAPEAFGKVARRLENKDKVNRIVVSWALASPAATLLDQCAEFGVPCALVNTIEDIFLDPQFEARQNLITISAEDGKKYTVPNTIPRLSKTLGRIVSLGPALGANNREVYCNELGLSEKDLQELARAGTI